MQAILGLTAIIFFTSAGLWVERILEVRRFRKCMIARMKASGYDKELGFITGKITNINRKDQYCWIKCDVSKREYFFPINKVYPPISDDRLDDNASKCHQYPTTHGTI